MALAERPWGPIMSGMDSSPERPSAALAFLSALVVGIVTVVLFPYVEAGPSANVLGPIYPFATGGFAFLTARRAARTWRALRDSRPADAQRGLGMLMAFVGVLISVVVIGWALIFILGMTVGFGIS